MTRLLRSLLATFAASSLLPAALCGQTVVARRLAQMPTANTARVPLEGSVSERPAVAERLGSMAVDAQLTGLSLVLKPTAEQDAALTQLLADQQNPSSPSYHQWLTPQQFGERFGVAEGDLAVLTSWLEAAGLRVDSVAPSRNSITFSGSVASVESAFSVTMDRYRRDGQEFFENSANVQLPGAMAGVISGVSGLSSYRMASPMNVRMPEQATASVHGVTASPQYTTSAGAHYLVPWDFRQIYGMNSLINGGYDGTGIKIGVIGQSAVDTQQITYFQQKTGQTVKMPTMVLVPNTGVSNRVSGDEGESELDIEYASGSAPGASVQFIYTGCTTTVSSSVLSSTTNCSNNGVFDALRYAITNNLAPILTLSYGGCESGLATYANSTLEPALKQANAQGQTIVVSSGDTGAATCDQSSSRVTTATKGLTVSYPASSQYVTAVGGTQLDSDNASSWSSTNNAALGSAVGYIDERAWNDTSALSSLAATGGGFSKIFAKPDWQAGPGVLEDGHRDLPDVAFPASVAYHPYMVCLGDAVCTSGSGGFIPRSDGGGVGGTSVSAPNFSAMMAIIEQANSSGALGNINPSLYSLAEGTSRSTVFHDVALGNNFVPCTTGTTDCTSGTLGYPATSNYDLATGLGSLDAASLRTALASVSSKLRPSVVLGVSAMSPDVRTAVTFRATVGGGGATPTGTVQFVLDGSAVGLPVAITDGIASYSYAGFGDVNSHQVSATYSGDTSYVSATVSLTVKAVPVVPIVTLVGNPVSPSINSNITFTATVQGTAGTPTGSIEFLQDGISRTTVTLVNGSASYLSPGFSTATLHNMAAVYAPNTALYYQRAASLDVVVTAPTQTLIPAMNLAISPTSAGIAAEAFEVNGSVIGSGSHVPTGDVYLSIDGSRYTTRFPSTISTGIVLQTAINGLALGTHTAALVFNGDNYYKPSVSSVITLTVIPSGFTMAASPTSLTVAYGSAVQTGLTFTSYGGLTTTPTYSVSLLGSTGPAFAGCFKLSALPTITPGQTVTTQLTIGTLSTSCTQTSATSLFLLQSKVQVPMQHRLPTALTMVGAGVLGCFVMRRRRPANVLCVSILALLIAGCSGGGSSADGANSGGGTSASSGGTTANSGTYLFRLTATGSGYTATSDIALVVK